MQHDTDFWQMIYRAVMMIASAIKRYKLDPPEEDLPLTPAEAQARLNGRSH